MEHIEITLPRKQGEMVKEGDSLGKERKEEGREWGDYNTRFARFLIIYNLVI